MARASHAVMDPLTVVFVLISKVVPFFLSFFVRDSPTALKTHILMLGLSFHFKSCINLHDAGKGEHFIL